MRAPAEEIRLAEETLRRIARRASGCDWLPVVEETPEDVLVHGVATVEEDSGEEEALVVGGCSCSEITDEDAMYISLLSPAMAIPLADWLADAADLAAQGGFTDEAPARMLGRALRFSITLNQRYRKIRATGIHERGMM